MGSYTTRIASTEEIKQIVFYLENGYTYNGVKHRSNHQVATIMRLQANLGCRIGDIVHLTTEDIAFDGTAWRLNMVEKKTGKKRWFSIPTGTVATIHEWMKHKGIKTGRLFSIEEPAVWKQMRAVTGFLGYEEVAPHSFRKAAAMRVYSSSGYDIAATSQYLNHSNTATTLIYLHRSPKQMDDIVSKAVVDF